jgi:hypothetical protein
VNSIGVVGNSVDTFAFTEVLGYTVAGGDYEYSSDAGVSYVPLLTNPIGGFSGNYAICDIRVRVKAATSRNAGAYLHNGSIYTANDGDVNWLEEANVTQIGNDIASNTTVANYGAISQQALSPTALGVFYWKFSANMISESGTVRSNVDLLSASEYALLSNNPENTYFADFAGWYRDTSLYRQKHLPIAGYSCERSRNNHLRNRHQ